MARSFGVLKTQLWDAGSEFRELDLAAQWAYEMLISQPAINNCGVLAYQPRKWAKLAANLNAVVLQEALGQLRGRLFIVVDEDTGELLVRTFIKHDRIWKQPNLITAARKEYLSVESELIRGILAHQHPWLLSTAPVDDVRNTEEQARSGPLPEPLAKGVREGLPEGVLYARDAGAHARPLPLPLDQPPPLPEAVRTETSSSRTTATPDDDLLLELDKLKPGSAQRQRWRTAAAQEPDRLRACLNAARTAQKPAAYLDDLLKRGEWPAPPDTNSKTLTTYERAKNHVRNALWQMTNPAEALRDEYPALTADQVVELADLAAELARERAPAEPVDVSQLVNPSTERKIA